MHPSVATIWRDFLGASAHDVERGQPISHWHFCDNEQDADECARLVLVGKKRATAPGEAQCIIRVVGVETLPFHEVTEEHARDEGEGDGTLAWWRAAHRSYYSREMTGAGLAPAQDMPVVFQRFERVCPA